MRRARSNRVPARACLAEPCPEYRVVAGAGADRPVLAVLAAAARTALKMHEKAIAATKERLAADAEAPSAPPAE